MREAAPAEPFGSRMCAYSTLGEGQQLKIKDMFPSVSDSSLVAVFPSRTRVDQAVRGLFGPHSVKSRFEAASGETYLQVEIDPLSRQEWIMEGTVLRTTRCSNSERRLMERRLAQAAAAPDPL